jgi:hypothetical protein
MIYPDKPFYVVSGFSPRTDINLSAFNFCIGLNFDFALKSYDKELTESAYNRLNETRNEILKSIKLDFGSPNAYPYRFLENDKGNLTYLLSGCNVSGDACDLGIEWMELDSIKKRDPYHSKIIIYGPHNVDSPKQAYGLLSIWLNWADFAFATIQEK